MRMLQGVYDVVVKIAAVTGFSSDGNPAFIRSAGFRPPVDSEIVPM
jgi:hypothetical protein